MSPSVAVVVPTLNEAENLAELVGALEDALPQGEGRIIIVDDASPDGTADLADSLNSRYGNISVLRRPGKLGIGSAVLDGMRLALSYPDTQSVVTMDSDLSHNPRELPSLLSAAKGADFVQGSRYMKGGRIYGWPFHRRLISGGINAFYRFFLRTGLRENTTNYRVYSRNCAETLVEQVKCTGYELPILAILAARDNGHTIVESPVTFTDRSRGKSKLTTRDLAKAFVLAARLFFQRVGRRPGLTETRRRELKHLK